MKCVSGRRRPVSHFTGLYFSTEVYRENSIGFLDAAPQVATRKLAVWHLVTMIHPWHTHTHAQTLSPLITGIGLLLMHHFLSVGRAGKGMGLGGWVRG